MNVHEQTDGRACRRGARRFRRGTSVTEFVLVLPILAIVLGLTFFFGWGLMNKHQVLVADRYSAWQRIETGSWPSEDTLNEKVFKKRATQVSLSSGGVVWQTARDLVDETGSYSAGTEQLAEELLLNRFPGGRQANVAASFGADLALWARFAGPIHHHHGREGVTWRRDEVHCWDTLRDQYYGGLDNGLRRVAPPTHNMAKMIRGLYLARW